MVSLMLVVLEVVEEALTGIMGGDLQLSGNVSGAKGFSLSFTKSSGAYGGSGGHYFKNGWFNAGIGGSGGFDSGYVTVTEGENVKIVVGVGGTSRSESTTSYYGYVESGTSGFVLIAYGGDI